MGFERQASARGSVPAGVAILASAALGAGLTVLAGAGPTAAAAHAGAARPGAGRAAPAAAPAGTISTVAGGVGGPAAATSVNLGVSTSIAGTASSPCGVSFAQGHLLVADNWTVRSIDPVSDQLTTPIGTAASGPFGDGGPAASTPVDTCSVTADVAGNLVIADVANDRIRVVPAATGTFYGQPMTAGDVYTVAGTGSFGFSGDGGPATSARLSDPARVTVDAAGNLVLASTFDNRVRVVADQTGTFYGQPMTAGDIYTIAGTGTQGFTGDGGPAATAELAKPQDVNVDAAGNLLLADTGNQVIRVVADQTGTFYGQPMTVGDIYTIAGTGTQGFTGDGGPAASAELNAPQGVTVDGVGNVVVADTGNSRVRVIAATTGTYYGQQMAAGDVYTVAGGGTTGLPGDGGPAAAARLSLPYAVAVDAAGNAVVADTGDSRIRVAAAASGSFYGQAMTAGDMYTVAGTGTPGFSGDRHPATAAKLNGAEGVTVTSAGNLVLADTGNNRIRVVAATTGTFYGQHMTTGDIYTVAGTGTAGYAGDGGAAVSARLSVPAGAAADASGNLVVADSGNNVIRVAAATTGTFYGQPMTAGDIYTIAGTGTQGFTSDGGPATSAGMAVPADVAVDGAGNVLITDFGDNRVRVVAATTGTFYGQPMTAGDIYTIAGTGTGGFAGDGGPATGATLYYPQGMAVDGAGDILVTDSGNNRVRMVAGPDSVAATGRPARRAHTARPPADRHGAGAGGAASAGPYVTLLFSRSELTAADGCVSDDSGIARLDTAVAPYLRSLGMTGTGTLTTGVTQATAPNCVHGGDSLSASWADAASLAGNFGWSFVSHTATYPPQLAKLTATQSYAQTCGSAASLDGHGLPGGHGLIAYPGAQRSPVALQTGFGANCFAWGRMYNKTGVTPAAAAATPPFWQETLVANGGACNVQTAPCYNVASATGGHPRYLLPSTIIAQIQALQPGQWFTLQSYVLVTGSNPGYAHDADRWDCTSPDPSLHWTNDSERYCYSDWQQIVSAIAALPGVTVTDPLTVGVAFGRPASYR
jgi:hypothetical protein